MNVLEGPRERQSEFLLECSTTPSADRDNI